jgi:hypothetical protein
MDETVDMDSMVCYLRPCGLQSCVTHLDFRRVVAAGVVGRRKCRPIKVAILAKVSGLYGTHIIPLGNTYVFHTHFEGNQLRVAPFKPSGSLCHITLLEPLVILTAILPTRGHTAPHEQ